MTAHKFYSCVQLVLQLMHSGGRYDRSILITMAEEDMTAHE